MADKSFWFLAILLLSNILLLCYGIGYKTAEHEFQKETETEPITVTETITVNRPISFGDPVEVTITECPINTTGGYS